MVILPLAPPAILRGLGEFILGFSGAVMLRISRWAFLAGLVFGLGLVGSAAQAQGAKSDVTGWYIGLGVGWDHLGGFNETVAPGTRLNIDTDDTALVTGSLGYRFADHVRLEAEIGFDRHDVSNPLNGHAGNTTVMANGMYDIATVNNFTFALGGGLGLTSFNYCTGVGATPCTGGTVTGFAGQVIGEADLNVTSSIAVFLQTRERFFAFNNNAPIASYNETAATVGLRYTFAPPPPPVPPHPATR
jgi:OOP family OmpA-OmpF porin